MFLPIFLLGMYCISWACYSSSRCGNLDSLLIHYTVQVKFKMSTCGPWSLYYCNMLNKAIPCKIWKWYKVLQKKKSLRPSSEQNSSPYQENWQLPSSPTRVKEALITCYWLPFQKNLSQSQLQLYPFQCQNPSINIINIFVAVVRFGVLFLFLVRITVARARTVTKLLQLPGIFQAFKLNLPHNTLIPPSKLIPQTHW